MPRFDPLQSFCFSVTLTGLVDGQSTYAFCKSVSGLKAEREVIPYKEGGNNVFTHKLVGPTNFPNLVLKRGFVSRSSGYQVLAKTFFEDLAADRATPRSSRFTGSIVQLGPDLKPRWKWEFSGGWICKWEGPDFDASKSELSFEAVEIAHNGFTFSEAT